MGSITGAKIRMVGVRSSAVPMSTNTIIITAINRRGFSTSGPSQLVSTLGRSASVIM
ncbi:hypothetical protein D3C72_2382070 [compost metagenome]